VRGESSERLSAVGMHGWRHGTTPRVCLTAQRAHMQHTHQPHSNTTHTHTLVHATHSTTEAAKKHPKADVFVNYASFRR
jgi:hypothetical protein